MTSTDAIQTALAHHNAGRLHDAENAYREILARDPHNSDALHLLGVIAYQVGQFPVAIDLIERAIAIQPNIGDYHAHLAQALELTGDRDRAIAAYRSAVQLDPAAPATLNALGSALRAAGRLEEAIAAYRSALATNPNDAVTLNNLGVVLQATHQLDPAIDAFRKSIALHRDFPETHNNLGNALQDSAQLPEALACFRKAIELLPSFHIAHSNLIYGMHFDPACEAAALLDEHRSWARIHAEPLTAAVVAAPAYPLDRDPNRRVHIGYVSGDLHDHPVGRFLLPILKSHDRSRFEISCYDDAGRSDAFAQGLRAACDHWNLSGALDDAQLAEKIRTDRIDILFDLAAHAPGNRLLAFARKPAPIQLTYLGYPGTTGMSAMDYRITDPHLDPPGSESSYTETSLRPAGNYWCYAPPANAPDVAPLPALTNRFITFGCLNNFAKTNPALVQTWCDLLDAVPGSRLLLHAHPGAHRDRVIDLFRSRNIDPARIDFISGQEFAHYLATYNRIDIALDPFPYNGGATSCDALWMGCPLITLAGKIAVHRAGASILSNVGLPHLIATSPAHYVQIARDLAASTSNLSDLRRTLRDRMRGSSMCDAASFTRNLETTLLEIWQQTCTTQPPRR